ncbi:hypothetical protein SAMN04487897_101403 [Paenibacillus sp. yr247]|nr:hypothetical protein SAMN04487897_101403 [Paenibacillus sp. yr247]
MIEIQSEVGFGASNVKQGRWTPVTMTLRNQGADLSGDVVSQSEQGFQLCTACRTSKRQHESRNDALAWIRLYEKQ